MPHTPYLIQTYTYSWENHCLYSEALHQNYLSAIVNGAIDFNFGEFLSEYSKLVYKPLLSVLDKRLSQHDLWRSIDIQYNAGDEEECGKLVLEKIKKNIEVLGESSMSEEFIMEYEQKGLNEQSAYLYVRGHNLFNTINAIGRALCKKHYEFTNNVLQGGLYYEYEEMRKIGNALNSIK